MRTDRGWRRFYAIGWSVSAIIGAAAVHQWHGRMRAVEEKLAEAERTREAIAQRVAAEERLRIARELHDSLTHSISVVKVQAGVAAHLARKRGEEVPEAIQAIQQAAGDAARELRETLGVLRGDTRTTSDGRGLADLPRLVDQARAAGLSAELRVTGPRRPVPREVDTAAYRIVQEALTNVRRHGRGVTSVRVEVAAADEGARVTVVDDGEPVERTQRQGHGLTGMQERVSALGGHFWAGPRPGRGWSVRAWIPLEKRR